MTAPSGGYREPCQGDPFCPAGMGLHYHGDTHEEVFRAEDEEAYGPLDAMVRMSPPWGTTLAWIERYGQVVLTRYVASLGVHADGGLEEQTTIMSETRFGTEAAAVREIAYRVTAMSGRGYRRVDDDDKP